MTENDDRPSDSPVEDYSNITSGHDYVALGEEAMKLELARAGWKQVAPTMWYSPSGDTFVGYSVQDICLSSLGAPPVTVNSCFGDFAPKRQSWWRRAADWISRCLR